MNPNRVIWEGWTVQNFIDALEPQIHMIMTGQSWKKPFKSRKELAKWCQENQPYYKYYIPEVVNYFAEGYSLH